VHGEVVVGIFAKSLHFSLNHKEEPRSNSTPDGAQAALKTERKQHPKWNASSCCKWWDVLLHPAVCHMP
jgi:hypothetical protein